MPIGCTNAKAVNYDPAATGDDGSCIYLKKVEGVCYAFADASLDHSITDQSFTLSYSFEGKDWVFFHTYIPDFYFSSREQLYNLKDKKVFIHHKGANGVYHSQAPASFFVDVVFANDSEMLLNSIKWITEVFNNNQEIEFSTLTHITIWNNQQCTGRITLNDLFQGLQYERRKTQAIWNFDDFRDMVAIYGTPFLLDIFHNFVVDTTNIDLNKPWFEQDLLHENHFIIRFEFDNSTGNRLMFHGADIDASKSYR